jgi:outer membrane usher protein
MAWPWRIRHSIAIFGLLSGLSIICASHVSASRILDPGDTPAEQPLQLDVIVNGRPANLLILVTRLPDGELAVERSELEAAGVKPPGRSEASERILLRRSGLDYRYDEAQQRIYFNLSDEQRIVKQYDSRGEQPRAPPPQSSWGGLLNYVLFTSSSTPVARWTPKLSGANASLDARFFSPFGELTQTGIVGNTVGDNVGRFGDVGSLRLDTTFSHVDHETLIAYRAGDVITGGFEWTRPARLGGLQIQRNFALRSDLVTAPLPSVSGSAAVPSTVDVFVNGSKSYSQQVDEGPFRITNLPIPVSGGNAEVIIRDASGRETKTEFSLFSGQRLLAEGLFDFTLESGFTRRFYAFRSNDYDKHPAGSGSFRYGFNDRVTLEGHAEGGVGVGNMGFGALAGLGPWGVSEFSLSGSHSAESTGSQIFASHTYPGPFGLSMSVSTQRSFGRYEDLASRTALNALAPNVVPWTGAFPFFVFAATILNPVPASVFGAYGLPPRAIDRASIGAPVYGIGGSASLAFAQVLVRDLNPLFSWKQNSRLLTASYSRQLPFDGSIFVTAYANLTGNRDRGIFAGVTFPLGGELRATLGAQSVPDPFTGKTKIAANAQIQKSMGGQIGDYGWALNGAAGENQLTGGNFSYRSAVGTARVDTLQQGKQFNASAQFEGAIAATDAGVVPGPAVTDAFAVVNAGAPGVTVLENNRAIGETNWFGRLLASNLRAYESNKIAIDPNTLPGDAIAESTKEVVAPMYRSGVGVDFGVKTNVRSVTLILTDPSGKPIETGSRGRLEGGGKFMVGYDGRAYVRGLSDVNSVVVDLGDHECHASFEFNPGPATKRELKATCE